jgi:phage gp46-like protein
MNQQGDVVLYQGIDDGDIMMTTGSYVAPGEDVPVSPEAFVVMDGGFETATYLSLFGGNQEDDGTAATALLSWWGNIGEAVPYRSRTQHLLSSLPATSSNMQRLKQAVLDDLAWFSEQNIAKTISAEVSIPALNRVRVVVDIDDFNATYESNWKSHL